MYDVLVCVKDFKKPAAANSCRWGRREELRWRRGSPWESRWGLLWNRAEDNFDIKRMSYIRWWQSQRQQHQRPNLIAKVSKERGKCKGCNGSDATLDLEFKILNSGFEIQDFMPTICWLELFMLLLVRHSLSKCVNLPRWVGWLVRLLLRESIHVKKSQSCGHFPYLP